MSSEDAAEALVRWRQRAESFMAAAATQSADCFKSAISDFQEGLTEEEVLKFKDANGLTLMHIAAAGGNQSLVEWLYSQVPELACEDKKGETPLHCAARAGAETVVNFLLEHMDSSARYQCNRDGVSPMQLSLHAPPEFATKVFDMFTQGASWQPSLAGSASHGSFLQWAVLTGSPDLVDKVCAFVPAEIIEREHSAGKESVIPPASILLSSAANALELLRPICEKVSEETLWREARDAEGSTVLHNAVEERNDLLAQRILSTSAGRGLANVVRKSDGLSPHQIAITQSLKDLLYFHTKAELRRTVTVSGRERKGITLKDDNFERAQGFKQIGNVSQSKGDSVAAQQNYLKALNALQWTEGAQYEDPKIKQLVSVIFANLSFIKLKQQDSQAALQEAKKAVYYSPEWAKGYYRLAQAYKALDDYDEATQQMYMAMLKDDTNVAIKTEFKAVLQEAQRRARAKSSID